MRNPDRVQLAEARELFFQLLFLNLVGQVSNVDSCASFVTHSVCVVSLRKTFSLFNVETRALSFVCVCVRARRSTV